LGLRAIVSEEKRDLHLKYFGQGIEIKEDRRRYEEYIFRFEWGEAD